MLNLREYDEELSTGDRRKNTEATTKNLAYAVTAPIKAGGNPYGQTRLPLPEAKGAPAEAQQDLTCTPSPSRVKKIDKYVMGRIVGRGAYNIVRLARDETDDKQYAMKIFYKHRMEEKPSEWVLMRREAATMKRAEHHPNVLHLHEVLETKSRICLVMDYVAGGDLFDAITTSEDNCLPERQVLEFSRQLASALAHCHSVGVAHRDVKPSNVLVSKDGKQVKICDFGLSRFQGKRSMCSTSVGSPHYCAPEIAKLEGKYDGAAADVWSLGVLMYVMCTGMLPFFSKNTPRLLNKILKGEYKPITESPLTALIVESCLQVDPNRRAPAADVAQMCENALEFLG